MASGRGLYFPSPRNYGIVKKKVEKDTKKKKEKKRVHGNKVFLRIQFFDNAHIDFETILIFVHAYVWECFLYVFIRSELKITDKGMCDWASFCSEVLIEWCCKRDGQGQIVEIDESKFGKKKCNMGRLVEGQWVFGGVCQERWECFMVPVEQQDSKTLLTIIKDRILPGTTIISDCWKAYNCL